MHTETAVRIRGPVDTIFRYAAQVEHWPRFLPHYRGVRVLSSDGAGRLVEMKARRGWIPIWWQARQIVQPRERRIRFTHVRGVTRGMEVEWRLDPGPAGDVAVAIVHNLDLRWPLIGPAVARWIIGPMFVEPTARRTLRHIKRIVEDEARPPQPPPGRAPIGPSKT
jgi:ribosome-associated toxin RatA of RatAB toxin-antitoxin module